MSTHTARVIPEKRYSCPPADVHLAGVEKGIDMKLTYGEQLKRPEWQKMRLRVLENAGWKCEQCGNKEQMLHVHHKRYIKGRMAWDYELDNFEALCESCHKDNHQHRERIEVVLASIPGYMWEQAADVLTFWAWDYLPDETARPVNPFEDAVQELAYTCREKLGVNQILDLIEIATKMPKSSASIPGLKD